MDAAAQDKILGYFIEEAKEHLETIEKGILELSTVVNDSERINELFRAAHSLKGGAAMLNISSIQKTSHRLEDAFKILRDEEATVDQKLEELFWDAYDVLQDLIERLQSALGLQEDEAEAIVKEADPTFVELQHYLEQQKGTGKKEAKPTPSSLEAEVEAEDDHYQDIIEQLREMLKIFKEQPTPDNRHQLQEICTDLGIVAPEVQGWQNLLTVSAKAIANPQHSYQLLAPVVIKELKQAADYLELGEKEQISPTPALERLANTSTPQILITVEPQAAAQVLLQVFNQAQVSQLVNLLQK
ncbi:MAG: histidine kinase [Gloeocapsa sp. DLM2.Bin57]|nr:MAG: histidine kinase [Gloeocapsa sp. DLM2.Bin57]